MAGFLLIAPRAGSALQLFGSITFNPGNCDTTLIDLSTSGFRKECCLDAATTVSADSRPPEASVSGTSPRAFTLSLRGKFWIVNAKQAGRR